MENKENRENKKIGKIIFGIFMTAYTVHNPGVRPAPNILSAVTTARTMVLCLKT